MSNSPFYKPLAPISARIGLRLTGKNAGNTPDFLHKKTHFPLNPQIGRLNPHVSSLLMIIYTGWLVVGLVV